ncbi:hypothetical protein LCGC14_2585210 [marine sediment metagenome]|uniref:Uncharacterized protein n=1 Tax=marine sediment metagenome TaxID=412755 RepID=A0A0F9B168_9ZZZZ
MKAAFDMTFKEITADVIADAENMMFVETKQAVGFMVVGNQIYNEFVKAITHPHKIASVIKIREMEVYKGVHEDSDHYYIAEPNQINFFSKNKVYMVTATKELKPDYPFKGPDTLYDKSGTT